MEDNPDEIINIGDNEGKNPDKEEEEEADDNNNQGNVPNPGNPEAEAGNMAQGGSPRWATEQHRRFLWK